MKLCLSCNAEFNSPDWRCPVCDNVPGFSEGFTTFIPDSESSRPEYKVEHYPELVKLEDGNFWFYARNELIIWAINRYFSEANNFYEIGCGTGFVLAGLSRAIPDLHLSGSEIYLEGLKYARERVERAQLLQIDASDIPFSNEFDVTGAFDVLEHIQDDETVLGQLYKATCPGGGMILTVPQHEFLWSYQDVAASHIRRYRASDLKHKVEKAGFELIRVTSFVSLLLPVMLGMRFAVRGPQKQYDPQGELRVGKVINYLLARIMDIEIGSIRAGMSFPAGGSLLLIARKPSEPDMQVAH